MSDPAVGGVGADGDDGDDGDAGDETFARNDGDDLPERVIVVREPIGSDPEAAAAELEALVAEAAAEAEPEPEPVEEAEEPPAIVDLDEVDLRTDALDGEIPLAAFDDRDDVDALLAEVVAGQVDDDVEDPAPEARPFAWADDEDEVPSEPAAQPEPEPEPEPEPFRWPDEEPPAWSGPERDETGPGTLRPTVPEPVLVGKQKPKKQHASTASRSRRTVRRIRALLALVFVVVLSGVGLAAAIGAAVLLIVLALSRAFGSGG